MTELRQFAFLSRQLAVPVEAGLPRHEGVCRVAPAALLVPASCSASHKELAGGLAASMRFGSMSTTCTLCAQSIKDMPVLQDGPPPGGFPSVRYARRIPSTGPAGFTLFAVTASIMAYGFINVSLRPSHAWWALTVTIPFRAAIALHSFSATSPVCVAVVRHAHHTQQPCNIQVGQTNHEKRAAKAEKKAARFAIMPILQAEEDRR